MWENSAKTELHNKNGIYVTFFSLNYNLIKEKTQLKLK